MNVCIYIYICMYIYVFMYVGPTYDVYMYVSMYESMHALTRRCYSKLRIGKSCLPARRTFVTVAGNPQHSVVYYRVTHCTDHYGAEPTADTWEVSAEVRGKVTKFKTILNNIFFMLCKLPLYPSSNIKFIVSEHHHHFNADV